MQPRRLAEILWKLVQSPVVVFVVALTIRLWLAAKLLPPQSWQYFYGYNEFARIAWSIVSGYGYSSPWPYTPLLPTAQQPPVYAYVLAAIFKFAGAYSYTSLWIAVALNAIISSFTATLILAIGKRDFGTPAGVLAAWVWSCWLYEAAEGIRLWESSLAALLLALSLLMLPRLAQSTRIRYWLLSGVFAGAAVLTNTTLLSVFPFFWIWLWLDCNNRGQARRKQVLASVTMFVLVLVPWTTRNYLVFGRLIPIRDNFGLELWLGNHAGVIDRFDNDFPILDPTMYNREGEIRFMEGKREIALAYIRQHPGRFLKLSARRFLRYWTFPEPLLWGTISSMAWVGVLAGLQRSRSTKVPYLIVLLMFPLVYYVTHTFNSYRHPTEPEMFLVAAYAAATAVQKTLGKSGFARTQPG